jgi:sugar lactone lactonase YvrE
LQGSIAGGTVVSIRGAALSGAVVKIDRRTVEPLSHAESEVRLQMPAHDNGYAVISVGDAFGRFLYVPPPLRDLPAGFITTVAGIGLYVGEYGPANAASIRPWGLALDSHGIAYFADAEHNRVFRVRNGFLEPFIGTGLNASPNTESGLPAIDTMISFPRGIAFDSRGNLYVPDSNYYLWRVTPAGIAEIVAGNGHERFSGDGGPARQAEVGHVSYVAVDPDDNIYFIDWTNARVRKIDTSGTISTYVGTGVYGFSGDGGPAAQAQFSLPFPDMGGLAIDRNGNLLLLDYGNHRIRRIDRATGIVTTAVAETPSGPRMNDMRALAVNPANEILFSNAAVVYRQKSDGTVALFSSGASGFSEDGELFSTAKIAGAAAIAFDSAGNLFYSEGGRLRTVDSSGRIRTIAGNSPSSLGEGGPAVAAAMITPYMSLDILPTGELAIADNDRIRKIDRDGNLIRFVGSGLPGPTDDVLALSANVSPMSIYIASDGTLDYTTGTIGFIQRVDPDGVVRRTAGVFGPCVFGGDGGEARSASFCQPWDVTRDAERNIYIADTNNNRIRRVDAHTGVITTFAGSGAVNGLEHYGAGTTSGDGGPATNASINTPWAVVFDDDGNLYVTENAERIRRIDRNGVIVTLVQGGASKLTWAFGNLFTASGDAVRRISTTGTVTRLTDGSGFSGDGAAASQAHIRAGKQQGITVDGQGNLFFADADNLRVRAIRYGAVLAPPGAAIQATRTGSTIRATVFDAGGHPVPGVRVDFTSPASGASCTLSSSFAVSDLSGVATVSCTSNCVGGTYNVTARPITAAAVANISFTNVAGPCRRRSVRH